MIEQRSRTYWAAASTDDIGSEVRRKAREYRTYCDSSGRAAIWRRSMLAVYGLDPEGSYRSSSAVTFTGDEGENIELRINYLRTLLRATVVLATGSRPSYTCRARAYDAQTTELVGIGNAILDAYLDRDIEQVTTLADEYAITYGDSALVTTWNKNIGPAVGRGPDGRIQRDGDVEVRCYRPDEVVRDTSVTNWNHDWVIVHERHSRWDLAAQYPQWAEHILAAPSYDTDVIVSSLWASFWTARERKDADQIVVQAFYHRATSALPEGRAVIVVNGQAIADAPNPYGERLPVAWLVPAPETGTAFGYGEIWDLLAPSAALDSVVSMAVTMQENFGLVNLVAPTNVDVDSEMISSGTRVLYSNVAPSPMAANAQGVSNAVQMAEFLKAELQSLRSMNEAALGQGSSAPSGASLAMQMQIATQNNAGVVRSYLQAFREVMRQTLECVQKFATEERVVRIVGRNNSTRVKRWKGETLRGLDGVDVELGSSEMRTTQMRHQVVNDLLSAGLITSPTVALEMLATGRLEPAFDGPQALEASVERENEAMMNGNEVLVLETDDHPEHIRRHYTVLADPDVRMNPALVQMIEAHCNLHAEMWNRASMDPLGLTKLGAVGVPPAPGAALIQQQMAAEAQAMAGAMAGQQQAATVDPMAANEATPEPAPAPEVADPTTAPQGPSAGPAQMPSLPPDARPIPTTY